MPFWEGVKRCENCRFFKQGDPSDQHGTCEWKPEQAPFWFAESHAYPLNGVFWNNGTDCAAYRHEKRKPHVLDNARAYLALAQNGDTIPMRTYDRGDVVTGEAVVVHHNRSTVTVDFLNARYRIRMDAVEYPKYMHAGTIIGMERWGVDLSKPIKQGATFTVHPERAEPMLRNVRVGQKLNLIGYPPFDGVRRTARVVAVRPSEIVLKLGTRSVRHSHMARKGPLAGTVLGDVWVLDTTDPEVSDASETQVAAQREAPA